MSSSIKKLLKSLIGLSLSFFYLIPVFWMFISSLKDDKEVYSIPPTIIPENLTFSTYQKVLEVGGLRYFSNSIFIAVTSTVCILILSACTGFALSRLKSKWTGLLLFLFLIAQMLPSVLRATPLFILFQRMGLLNNFSSVLLADISMNIPFAVIMLRAFYMEIPKELEDAAMIDGCSRFSAFLRIITPLVQVGLIIVGCLCFVWTFGDFIYAVSFLKQREMQPATVGLYNFIGSEVTEWNNVMAFAVFTAFPLIFLFLFVQKYIVKGITAGSYR